MSFPSRTAGGVFGLEDGFGVRGGAEAEDEELWLVEEDVDTDIWLASWRKIRSLRRRFQPSSSLKPPTPAERSKLNLRGDRGEGRAFVRGFRLTGSASSRLVGLGWSPRRVAGGRWGSSGAERRPCRREGNFLCLKSEPESDHSHSGEPDRENVMQGILSWFQVWTLTGLFRTFQV